MITVCFLLKRIKVSSGGGGVISISKTLSAKDTHLREREHVHISHGNLANCQKIENPISSAGSLEFELGMFAIKVGSGVGVASDLGEKTRGRANGESRVLGLFYRKDIHKGLHVTP